MATWKDVSYAEIGASLFNNSSFGLLLRGGSLFVVSNLVVFEILWADDNWFSSIITLLQYPSASYMNLTNYVKTLITIKKDLLFGNHSQQQY